MERPLNQDEKFMRLAIEEALKALDKGEVPIGAVVVSNGMVIGRGHNLVETLGDATAHAEMQALTAAMEYLGGKYLPDCQLYVTLEPCVMCAGALFWSKIGSVIYGASDAKRGCTAISQPLFHPKTAVRKGVLEEDCSHLLTDFFKKRRKE